MRRGSIAYRVLTHSKTPVLALPRRRLGGRFPVRALKAINEILTARDRAEMAGIDALLSVARVVNNSSREASIQEFHGLAERYDEAAKALEPDAPPAPQGPDRPTRTKGLCHM
jgi:hypothetical protein